MQYRLLICLLAISLLTVNWRVSNTHIMTTKIPKSLKPDTVIQKLQNQMSFIALNPVINNITHISTDAAIHKDNWLSTRRADEPIETYKISSSITFIPWIGRLGQKNIQFRTWLRNTESGVKTKAEAPFGVSVRSQWSVQPATTLVVEDLEWTLAVQRTVECVWWLMPFVAYTYDGVHASVSRDLVKPAGMEKAIPW
ncbi:hypothetical protein BDV59DRAFT_196417 [Aspergillus ambiguus]|uniref:uncharacterized protein n=1 Tax=Aspergillus ambiguus TaxID=176160 RepID=UPI003CCDFD9B